MDAPHRSTLPPKEPDQAPPTMEDLCAEKDFFDWIVAIADLQALTAKEVTGVLQPSEFAAIWNTRLTGSEEASPLAPWTANTSTKQRRP